MRKITDIEQKGYFKIRDLILQRFDQPMADNLIAELRKCIENDLNDEDTMIKLVKVLKDDLDDDLIWNMRDLFVIRPISIHGVPPPSARLKELLEMKKE
ncbi:MAG: hypothetical protein ACFE8L_07525 [Candidatus Hodarchaeota archaeon]